MVAHPAKAVKNEHSFYNEGMPRVSADHLAARRQQILDAARSCFLRNGFHATSMQDVIKEAKLSVGAVYRYFPSKNDLITALAGQVIGEISGVFAAVAAAQPPPPLHEIMSRVVDIATANTGPDGALRLAVHIWSESLRDEALAEFVSEIYGRLRDIMVLIARRAQEHGDLPTDADPVAVGSVLLAVLPGYALQRILTGQPEPEAFQAGLRTLLSARAG
jgi:AcrR family transcriptional regulator